jgi:hypothetical protein
LLSNLEDDVLAKILREISRRALENSEEKGLSTLFVTFGMATWPALDGGRPAEAPVLLLPVAITKKEGSNSYYLSAAGSFQLNLVLLHVLEDQFNVKLQPEELLAEFPGCRPPPPRESAGVSTPRSPPRSPKASLRQWAILC